MVNNECNYKTLTDFLDNHRVGKGCIHTHTSMGKPHGAFKIEDNKLEIFYKLYENAISGGEDIHLIEKHNEVSPILVDFDFKFDLNTSTRQYTKCHIQQIVSLYMEELETNFNFNNKSEELIAFVFERSDPYQTKTITKDGIHIIFPFIITEPYAQYMLRDNILKKIENILSDINLKNPISDVVDRCIIQKNGWLMYGSRKPNCDPYKLTYVYDCHREIINYDEVDYNGIDNLAKFLSIRRHSIGDCLELKDPKLTAKYKKKVTKSKIKNSKVTYNYEYVRSLVNILSIDRCTEFEKWLEVGICLNSIDNTELFSVWDEFSKKSEKYDEAGCIQKWSEITETNKDRKELTIASLIYWAKNDNFQKFMEIKRVDVQKKLEDTIRSAVPNNWDIANVLYEMYQNQFVFSKKCWYEFKNHKWDAEEDGLCLRKKISTELVEEYLRLNSQYNDIAADAGDEGDDSKKEEYLNQTKKIIKIINNIKSTGFKDNVMKECKELFHDKKFCDKLDVHEYLIGFDNGVYDLKNMEFRDGRPDDYITLSTNTSYIEYYDDCGEASEIEDFMSKIIIDEEVRLYLLLLLSSFLQGVNAEEKFRIWTGSGSNGKSKLLELFISSFGDYCIKFPVTLLTGKRAQSNACTPEIVQAVGKRFGYFDEPNENERINVGLMKEYTGGDKIKARGLHKDPIEFKPQFKLVLLCNELPKVPPNDDGTWRRMEVAEFKSKFVDNPKEPHEFERDNYLSEKIKQWKEIFLSWLIDKYYRIYRDEGITVPKEILKFTNEYKKTCDMYAEFLDELVEKGDKNDIINLSDLYEEYKIWHTENYNGVKVIVTKKIFKKFIENKFKKADINKKGISGYKFKSKNFEIDENDISVL
jgi:P4 family phage/plasmid primase-like protien